jgi:hypothetical protein
MQSSVHSRMRRAVEKENRDIDKKIGGGNISKRKPRRRQKVNLCLVLLVLSPILVIGSVIYVLQQYTIWSAADADLDNLTPGKTDTTEHQVVSPRAALNKNKRLRKSRTEEAGNAAIVSKAENRRNMKRNPEKETTEAEETIDRPPAHNIKFLVLTTTHGNIKITLRPDLSQGSVDYIHKLVESYGGNGKRCTHCNFYRAEKPGILQGIMEHKGVVPINEVRGSCPPGSEGVDNDCPEWDEHCGCHGPVMTRGAVAWAAGEAGGPDFFIDAYPDPAKWWGSQHTNFGFIEDDTSLKIIDSIFELPIESSEGMDFLKDSIHFDLVL